ncbi:MAG: EAL domain-containing protein [Pseudomonadota bacterium]
MLPKKLSALPLEAQASFAAFFIGLLVAFASLSSGLSAMIEADMRYARDTLRSAQTDSDIVIVEVDGRSLQEIAEWPWPRENYAKAVAELDRLGAKQIAFDIEFSARSSPEQDQIFAKALTEAEASIVLPTFRQHNLATGDNSVSEALPLPELRENAFLASVNVVPDADGNITHYGFGTVTNDVPRPSLASMISGTAGDINDTFRIDQAIDPASFDRISFVDLIKGEVSAQQVDGKRVLIGATAIEMGDRYPTSLFGVQPGVVVQAQATETLIQDRVRTDVNQTILLVLAALVVLVVVSNRSRRRYTLLALFASAGVLTITALAADALNLAYLELASAMIFGVTFAVAQRLIRLLQNLTAARLTDLASGLQNKRSLEASHLENTGFSIAAVKIADYDQLEAVTADKEAGQLDRAIARRLELLAKGETVYRIENGVFGWLIPADRQDDLEGYFASANALFNAPVDMSGKQLRAKPFFGLSDTKISEAVLASEFARRRSLRWSSSASTMTEESQYEQAILTELDEALETGAISVVFQPKLKLPSRQITSAECLVRWNSPQLGQISPGEFIPLLESKDAIDRLTLFVLDEAISRVKLAASQGITLNLAVNISAQLLSDKGFVDAVAVRLEQICDLPGATITLEVTESAPLDDPEIAQRALASLRAAGARVSVDDYGTGHATLNYLKDFPANEIKLDQSFVSDLTTNQANRVMVSSTVELAHALSFEVVAEGVEDAQTLEALEALGCDYLQGWHIGKPMTWDEFAATSANEPKPKWVAG